jgi:hypothetical protein
MKTIDERIDALTQSVELLAAIHRDNEARAEERAARQARLEDALMLGIVAFMREWKRKENGNGEAS